MGLISVDSGFKNILEQLASDSQSASDAATALTQRTWMTPPLNGWSGDPQDIAGCNVSFSRDQLNTLYALVMLVEAFKGTTGECAAAKVQVDYIATLERGFRTRHTGRIRATMHAAGRRAGHGAPGANGLFTGSVIPYIQDLLTAAAKRG